MEIKKTTGERIFTVFNVIFMLFMIVITLYPMLYVLFASFSNANLLMAHQGVLLGPLGFSTKAYAEVFKNSMVISSFKNTVIYVLVGTAINMLVTTMGAYSLSRKRFRSRKYINIGIVITMFFSGGLIPTYLIVRDLGLYNSMWAIVLPLAINSWNLIVMRTTFAEFPEELEEAATIDGANDFYILFKIVIPLCNATIAVIALFYAVANWNSWFQAAIYLSKRELYPLQLYLKEILISSNTDGMMGGASSATDAEAISETIKYTVIVVSTVPILLVYPFLQKYFVKGVMVGAIKG